MKQQKTKKHTLKERASHALGITAEDAKLSKSYMSVAFLALLIGGFLGLFQGLERAGLIQLPSWFTYYQVLTAHGILLVLVLTAFFAIGYFYAGLSHTLGGILPGVRTMA